MSAFAVAERPPALVPPTFHNLVIHWGMTRWAAWILTVAGSAGVCLALYAFAGPELVSSIDATVARSHRPTTASITFGQGSRPNGGVVGSERREPGLPFCCHLDHRLMYNGRVRNGRAERQPEGLAKL